MAEVQDNWSILRPIDAMYDEPGVGLFDNFHWRVSAHRYNELYSDIIAINSTPLFGPTIIDNNNPAYISTLTLLDSFPGYGYHIDTLMPYKIEITRLDTAKNIISGKFDFYALSQSKWDTIHLTNG